MTDHNRKQLDPLSITQAIVELGLPKLQAASEYARTCMSMLAAGVPRSEVPRVLNVDDADVKDTHALRAISKWGEEPDGLLAVCGPVGTGKSWAAARLVLKRLRGGRRSTWLPLVAWPAHDLDAQGRWVSEADRAPLLVLDDLGAGLTSPRADKSGGGYGGHLRNVVEGVLLRAIAEGRPAILISNGSREEVEAYLDGRIVDRTAMSGGFVEIDAKTKSLRDKSRTQLDAFGRWPRWAAAVRLLEQFGVDGQRFALEAQRLHNTRGEEAREELRAHHKRGAEVLDLDRADVLARARVVDALTTELLGEVSRKLGVEVSEPTFDAVAQALGKRIGLARQSTLAGYTGPRDYAPPPELPRLDSEQARRARESMAPLGYTVAPSKMGGYILKHGGRALSFDWPTAEQAWISCHQQHQQQTTEASA